MLLAVTAAPSFWIKRMVAIGSSVIPHTNKHHWCTVHTIACNPCQCPSFLRKWFWFQWTMLSIEWIPSCGMTVRSLHCPHWLQSKNSKLAHKNASLLKKCSCLSDDFVNEAHKLKLQFLVLQITENFNEVLFHDPLLIVSASCVKCKQRFGSFQNELNSKFLTTKLLDGAQWLIFDHWVSFFMAIPETFTRQSLHRKVRQLNFFPMLTGLLVKNFLFCGVSFVTGFSCLVWWIPSKIGPQFHLELFPQCVAALPSPKTENATIVPAIIHHLVAVMFQSHMKEHLSSDWVTGGNHLTTEEQLNRAFFWSFTR